MEQALGHTDDILRASRELNKRIWGTFPIEEARALASFHSRQSRIYRQAVLEAEQAQGIPHIDARKIRRT
jgi:hypothetical protein